MREAGCNTTRTRTSSVVAADRGIDDDINGRIDDVVDVVAPGEVIWSGYVYSVTEAQYSYILGDLVTVLGLDAYVNVSK